MTNREIAESKIIKACMPTINELCSDIGELLQLSNAHFAISMRLRGSYVYSVTSDGGYITLKNTDNSMNKRDRTDIIIEKLKEKRSIYANVFLKSAHIFDALVKRNHADKAYAVLHGYESYTVERIAIDRNGCPYLILMVDGTEQHMSHPRLTEQILGLKFTELSVAAPFLEPDTKGEYFVFDGYPYSIVKTFSAYNPKDTIVAHRDSYRRI